MVSFLLEKIIKMCIFAVRF